MNLMHGPILVIVYSDNGGERDVVETRFRQDFLSSPRRLYVKDGYTGRLYPRTQGKRL